MTIDLVITDADTLDAHSFRTLRLSQNVFL